MCGAFVFLFECGKYYVRAQVPSPTGSLAYLKQAYIAQNEK